MQKSKNECRVLLTGGHAATTALATVEELLRRKDKNWEIYWVGSKRAIEGGSVSTLESKYLPKAGVAFHPIVTGRLQRRFTIWTIPSLLKIPFGFFHALFIVLKIRPDIILSFGGFAAFPVVVVGWILGVPVILHEQTMAAGRANKLSSFFATKIALARKQSLKYFPDKKSVVVGNPIMTQILEVESKGKLGDPPVVFVMGGSRGSQIINRLIKSVLSELLEDCFVIHQVGDLDYKKFERIKRSLSEKLSKRYEIYTTIDPMQIDGVYKRADIVIARAGANTVSEIISVKRPAILIPIPWSYKNEQGKNAQFAKKFGLVEILDQERAKSIDLRDAVEKVFENWERMVKKASVKKSPDRKASRKLIDLVEKYV